MNLHERIAESLGWTVEQARSFSLPTLREIVRPVNSKLAYEITQVIRCPDEYYLGEPLKPKLKVDFEIDELSPVGVEPAR